MKPTPRRSDGGVTKQKRVGPVKRRLKQLSKAVAERQAAVAARKAQAERDMTAAVARALTAVTPAEIAAINADPKLARKVNEEAAVQAAAKYGVNIRQANGKIDMRLARKAAEVAAIQSAAEVGVDITNARGKISRRKALEAARLVEAARAGKDVDPQVKAAVERQDAALATAVREAQQRGYSLTQLGLDAIQSDPALAGQVAEEAVIQAAIDLGIDIHLDNGQIDPQKAREVARLSAIKTAAEMGLDITNARGKISRRKALEAAKLADAARAGKPVSAQVQAAVSRQDARLMAAWRAAERRGEDPARVGGTGTRRDRFDDAELAGLIRRKLDQTIR